MHNLTQHWLTQHWPLRARGITDHVRFMDRSPHAVIGKLLGLNLRQRLRGTCRVRPVAAA